MNSRFEIKYTTTAEHYSDVQKYLRKTVGRECKKNISVKIYSWIFLFFAVFSVVTIHDFYHQHPRYNLSQLDLGILSIIIGFVALLMFNRSYNRLLLANTFKSDGVYRSQHTLSLNEADVEVKTKNNVYYYSYADILRVEENNNLIFLFIDNGAAIYLPVGAFLDNQEKNKFITEVKKRAKII